MMQTNSIQKSDYQHDATDTLARSQFKFRILFGEFCLLKKVLSGQVIKPDIFSDAATTDINTLLAAIGADPGHIVSARCNETQTTGISTKSDRIVYTYKIYNRMYVDVSGSYDGFLARFRKKSLNSLNRKIKKAEKTNETCATIRDFTDASDVKEFVELAKPISMQSYQEAQLGTVFRTDDEWVRELETQAQNNRFRGYILHIDDTPVAYNYCPIYGDGVLLYDLSGYIPSAGKYSPGTVLQAHIIKNAFADDAVRFYDLCEGEGRHKEQFATGSHKCFNAYVFPNTFYYRSLGLLHQGMDRLSCRIVGVLTRFGVKDKIKTFLRRMGR
jgi:hypothetical protein